MANQGIYEMTDTWNNGATTFYGVKMNVTNSASAADSKLLDLQVGGTSKFNVGWDGVVNIKAMVKRPKGADIASATALTLGTDGNYFDVTGTTTITSIGTVGVGTVIRLHFDGAVTLTHHSTDLVLPGGVNITTAAGDELEFVEYASGDWRCTKYLVAAMPPVLPGQVKGTATNDDAAAGYVGEYKEAALAFGSAVSISSGVVGNLGSVSLTAGEWDVSLMVGYVWGAATVSNLSGSISLTSATLETDPGRYTIKLHGGRTVGTATETVETVPYRFKLSGTTTVYGVYSAAFSAGTASVFGLLRARRVR